MVISTDEKIFRGQCFNNAVNWCRTWGGNVRMEDVKKVAKEMYDEFRPWIRGDED
jgi:hypothetical protein